MPSKGRKDRGWQVRGRRATATITQPRRVSVSTASSPSRTVRGGVAIPRSRSLPQNRPWQQTPQAWFGPLTEWAVYWYLTEHGVGPNRRKLREGVDFFYQRGLRAPGLFAKKPFTRGDFILPGRGGALRGLVLDPITPFTHPVPWFDIRKRRILALQGWRVVYIEDYMLTKRDPTYAMELALAGRDISTRGQSQR